MSGLRQLIREKLLGGYLPCHVLSRRPLIFFAYDNDFTSNWEQFKGHIPVDRPSFLFLQLGWQHETDATALPFAEKLKAIVAERPRLAVTILANSPVELEKLGALGLRVIFCHQNAFLDERKYPLVKIEKKFDAIYVARVTPFKRHYLASQVESLYLVGSFHLRQKAFVDETLTMLKHAYYREVVPGRLMYRAMESARCGLCLSREEGAMFVSAEYLLCGLPLVNTENIGGRDYLFPEFAVKNVPDDPAAVAEAVAYWRGNAPDPGRIREATLEKMEQSREILRGLLREAYEAAGASCPAHLALPHKLGLRCTRMPWTNYFHGLRGRPSAS